MQDHLEMACAELKRTQTQLSNTQETTRNLEEKVEALERQLIEKRSGDRRENGKTHFFWKIDKFSEIVEKSFVFYTENYGYKLKILMKIEDGLCTSLIFLKGEYDSILPWPFKRKVILTLIDQQQDLGKRENLQLLGVYNPQIIRGVSRPMGGEIAEMAFFTVSHEQLKRRRYIVDDALFLQVEVDAP